MPTNTNRPARRMRQQTQSDPPAYPCHLSSTAPPYFRRYNPMPTPLPDEVYERQLRRWMTEILAWTLHANLERINDCLTQPRVSHSMLTERERKDLYNLATQFAAMTHLHITTGSHLSTARDDFVWIHREWYAPLARMGLAHRAPWLFEVLAQYGKAVYQPQRAVLPPEQGPKGITKYVMCFCNSINVRMYLMHRKQGKIYKEMIEKMVEHAQVKAILLARLKKAEKDRRILFVTQRSAHLTKITKTEVDKVMGWWQGE